MKRKAASSKGSTSKTKSTKGGKKSRADKVSISLCRAVMLIELVQAMVTDGDAGSVFSSLVGMDAQAFMDKYWEVLA